MRFLIKRIGAKKVTECDRMDETFKRHISTTGHNYCKGVIFEGRVRAAKKAFPEETGNAYRTIGKT